MIMRRPPSLFLVLAALLPAATTAAQRTVWDVPARGAHVYERLTRRFEVTPPPSKFSPVLAVRGGRDPKPHAWRYRTSARAGVAAGFELPEFDDASWAAGEFMKISSLYTATDEEEFALKSRIPTPRMNSVGLEAAKGVRISRFGVNVATSEMSFAPIASR